MRGSLSTLAIFADNTLRCFPLVTSWPPSLPRPTHRPADGWCDTAGRAWAPIRPPGPGPRTRQSSWQDRAGCQCQGPGPRWRRLSPSATTARPSARTQHAPMPCVTRCTAPAACMMAPRNRDSGTRDSPSGTRDTPKGVCPVCPTRAGAAVSRLSRHVPLCPACVSRFVAHAGQHGVTCQTRSFSAAIRRLASNPSFARLNAFRLVL